MALDKNKVAAEASKFVQRGQFDKAIRAYEKVLAVDPGDVRVLLKIGELQQKKGDNRAAAETFGRVADTYGQQGFFLKAVAVYKQMAKLAPEDVRVNERLAGLYQQLGLLSEAMGQLQIIATGAERAGEDDRLVDVLRRMVELDPDNIGSAVKLGEVYSKRGEAQLALELLRRAADQLKRSNRTDEYLRVADRISSLCPDDHRLLREVAALLLGRGDTKRGLAKLQVCFKANPKDVETLNLLAQAFQDLGQVSKMTSVFRELAQLHEESGRIVEARAAWRRVLELAPEDTQAVRALGGGRAVEAPAASREQTGRTPVPRPASGTPAPVPIARPPPPEPTPAPAPLRRDAPGPDAIPRLLTETEVYVKYGLHEKAIEHLDRVFSVDPDHLEALEKALKIHALRNDRQAAADAAARLVRAAARRGERDAAQTALTRLSELVPDHPDLAELAALLAPAAEAATDAGEELVLTDEEVVIELEPVRSQADDLALSAAAASASEEPVIDEPETAPPRPAGEGEPAATAEPPAAGHPGEPHLVANELTYPPEEVLELGDAVDPSRGGSSAEAEYVAPEALEPAEPEPVAPAPGEEPLVPAPSDESQALAALEEDLAEVDFFVGQRLFDDARDLLRELVAAHPGVAALERRLAEVEAVEAAAPPATPPARPAASGPQRIGRDLAEELERTPTPPPAGDYLYSVQDVFGQFKKGIERTVTPEDSATHYDLGIAYKEMGLLDDALHEFEVAYSGAPPARQVDCLAMLSACRAEKGDHRGAIEACRRALATAGLSEDTTRALEYQVAGAYEAAGDAESALFYLQRVVAGDPGYREARAAVARLGGGPGRPPPDDGVGDGAAGPDVGGEGAGRPPTGSA